MTTLFRDHGPIVGRVPSTDRAAAAPRPSAMRAPAENNPQWRDHAACSYEDPELFFPVGNTGPARLQIEDAKAVCRRCPVVDSCLEWALATSQDHGVWGGLSEDDRAALKRRQSRQRQREAKAEAKLAGVIGEAA